MEQHSAVAEALLELLSVAFLADSSISPRPRPLRFVRQRLGDPADQTGPPSLLDPRFSLRRSTIGFSPRRRAGHTRVELAGLRSGRIDPARRMVRVDWNLVEVRGHLGAGPPRTAAGHRPVALPRTVFDLIAAAVEKRSGDDYLFTGVDGGAIRSGSFRVRFWNPATDRELFASSTPAPSPGARVFRSDTWPPATRCSLR